MINGNPETRIAYFTTRNEAQAHAEAFNLIEAEMVNWDAQAHATADGVDPGDEPDNIYFVTLRTREGSHIRFARRGDFAARCR